MRRSCLGLLALLWLALISVASAADDFVPLPALASRITDLTATLDATQRGRLEAQLAALERVHGGQAAILLLPSTQPESIEQFSIRLAEAWKIGHQGADNGVIVIVAKDDRKMRIEVGYGLEGVIPDVVAKRIIEERMAPRFRQGDFFGGLVAAIEGLNQAMGGAPTEASDNEQGDQVSDAAASMKGEHADWVPWMFMLFFGAGVLHKMLGLLGSFAAAALGGWLGFMVFGSLAFGIGVAVLMFLFSFVSLFSGGSSGGSSGGGFSSGGGGFSGGGGDFGGGGASGSW